MTERNAESRKEEARSRVKFSSRETDGNHMLVIQMFGPHRSGAHWSDPRADGGDALDVEAAITFLRSRAASLRKGLEAADDPRTVGTVLGSHDADHEAWLALIAALQRADAEVAQEAATLYGFHGRMVGSLERGYDLRLDPLVAAQVRLLLGERLTAMTEQFVTLLMRCHPQRHGASA